MSKKRLFDNIFRSIIVIFSSTIYSLAVIWFLEPANLIAVGLTAVGQILNRLFAMVDVRIPIGVFSLVLNIPLCIFGAKHVSHRFIFFTVLSVLVQSFWTLGWDWLNIDFGIDPSDKFFLGVVAGLFGGCGIGLALRYGTSTGGVDIPALIAQKYFKIRVSYVSFGTDFIIIIVGFIVSLINFDSSEITS